MGAIFGKTLLNIKCVFWFSLQLRSEKFLILRIIKRDTVINVRTSLGQVVVILVGFYYNKCSRQISRKYSDIKFHGNQSSGSRDVPCGQKDGYDEANSRFSRFCELAYKQNRVEFYSYTGFKPRRCLWGVRLRAQGVYGESGCVRTHTPIVLIRHSGPAMRPPRCLKTQGPRLPSEWASHPRGSHRPFFHTAACYKVNQNRLSAVPLRELGYFKYKLLQSSTKYSRAAVWHQRAFQILTATTHVLVSASRNSKTSK